MNTFALWDHLPSLWDLIREGKIYDIKRLFSKPDSFSTLLDLFRNIITPGIVIGISGGPRSGKSFFAALMAISALGYDLNIIDTEFGFPSSSYLAYIQSLPFLPASKHTPLALKIKRALYINELYALLIETLYLSKAPSIIVVDSITRPFGIAQQDPVFNLSENLKALYLLLNCAAREMGHIVIITNHLNIRQNAPSFEPTWNKLCDIKILLASSRDTSLIDVAITCNAKSSSISVNPVDFSVISFN